jgi:hypothetical protein
MAFGSSPAAGREPAGCPRWGPARLARTGGRIWVLGEPASAVKLISIGLVLAGAIGLNLSGVTPP